MANMPHKLSAKHVCWHGQACSTGRPAVDCHRAARVCVHRLAVRLTACKYSQETLGRIAAASLAVEAALGGSPQDIEGVVTPDGAVHIVQSRPQV